LIIYRFTPRSRIFNLWRHHHCRWRAAKFKLGLCWALRAFEQGGIFFVPHLLWHGALVFLVSSEGPPYLVALTTRMGMRRIYFNPDPHGSYWSLKLYLPIYLLFFKLINVYIFKTNCKSYALSANYTNNLDQKKNLTWWYSH
jgi:hypothetical protein